MDAFYERLVVSAATLDEVLSDDFEPLSGQKGDADLAARRLAAWCRSCASGDWSLFGRRLDRDGLAFAPVLARLAAVRRSASASAARVDRRRHMDRSAHCKSRPCRANRCGRRRCLCIRTAFYLGGRAGRRAALVGS